MIDPQVAWDKLSNFQSAEELRHFFVGEGIKGVIGHAQMCPIANWLKQTTGWDIVTVAGAIKFFGALKEATPGTVVSDDIIRFDHTYATETFLENFDHVYYPELVDTEKCRINESGEVVGIVK